MKLSSPAFTDNGSIPAKYAHPRHPGGKDISIPLRWEGAPDTTKSFALTFIDISANDWVHWMVIDIPADTSSLPEGASGASLPSGAKELINTYGSAGYGGPKPPPGTGAHRYVATVYALNVEQLSLPKQPSYKQFLNAIKGKVAAQATTAGVLSR